MAMAQTDEQAGVEQALQYYMEGSSYSDADKVRQAFYKDADITTGGYRYREYEPPQLDREFTDPAWYWRHTVAPTGLTFYQGDEFPEWDGDLLVAGLSVGSLWRLNFEDGQIESLETLMINDRARTRKVIQSPGGKLYLLIDTQHTIIPGVRAVDNGPSGKLVRLKNAR